MQVSKVNEKNVWKFKNRFIKNKTHFVYVITSQFSFLKKWPFETNPLQQDNQPNSFVKDVIFPVDSVL